MKEQMAFGNMPGFLGILFLHLKSADLAGDWLGLGWQKGVAWEKLGRHGTSGCCWPARDQAGGSSWAHHCKAWLPRISIKLCVNSGNSHCREEARRPGWGRLHCNLQGRQTDALLFTDKHGMKRKEGH